MTPDQLLARLSAALVDRQLLDHPFYRRWEAGRLQPGELGAYAAQYRYFEASLPGILRALLARLEPGRAAELVQQNLTPPPTPGGHSSTTVKLPSRSQRDSAGVAPPPLTNPTNS